MKKLKPTEQLRNRITTRFLDHEIKQIKNDMKVKGLSFNSRGDKSEHIRAKVLN